MSTERAVLGFVEELKVFLGSRSDYFETFTRHGVQVEGWLKGEILNFLENNLPVGTSGFDREFMIGIGRKKVDFMLKIGDGASPKIAYIEIKHWLIGRQKGVRWTANSYFGDASSVGIRPDVDKLLKSKKENLFVLVLATANPGPDDWTSGIKKFNAKFKPLRVKGLTDPTDYLPTFFLGLLEVG